MRQREGNPTTVAVAASAKEAFLIRERKRERERERERDARESSSSRARIQNALLIRGKTWHDIALHGHGSESANAWIHYLTADSTFEGVAGYFYPKFLTK